MRYLLLSIFLCLSSLFLNAQNPIGLPQITNYSNLDYKGGVQTWNIAQDKNGVVYFANNEGLLTFDGWHWKLYSLPNKTIIRSLLINSDGRIYIGAQDEIGYFFPDDNGVLIYHSIKTLIPEAERQFADIWNIVNIKDELFFRTTNKIFQLKDDVIRVLKPETEWEFLGKANNTLFVQERHKGLVTYRDDSWQLICNNPVLNELAVTAILPYHNDTLLVTTLKQGLFLLHGSSLIKKVTSADAVFIRDHIYCAIPVNENWYAIGTTSGGCYIIDYSGRIIQQFSSAEGLQKNYIRTVFTDRNKNLWLGLDDGIDFVAFNSAIRHIYPDNNKQVSSYSIKIFNNTLYVGSSNGLFSSVLDPSVSDLSYSKNNFKEIKSTKGQVWDLSEINNHLLLAHEEGCFIVNGDQAKQLYSFPGTWLFKSLSPFYPAKDIIAGTYEGLQLIRFQNNSFINSGHIEGIKEPLRFLSFDINTNTVWASHPYRGIFKLKLSPDRKKIVKNVLYTEKDGLPSTLNNSLFRIKNRIVIATQNGIYEYNEKQNKFSASAFFAPIFNNSSIQYLNEDHEGNIWFISNKKVGVVDFHGGSGNKKFSVFYFPELTSKIVSGFENIYPYNKTNVFIGSNKGIYHINYLKYISNINKVNVLLSQVKLPGKKDSVIFGGYFVNGNELKPLQQTNAILSLPYHWNSLQFQFASTLFEQQNNIEFCYQLDGFDKEWSQWSAKSEKDYTNLPHGTYTFKVKARNNLGNESKPVTYTFTIEPAWYQTYWIYAFYLLCLLGVVYMLIKRQQKKYLKQQERLTYLHQLELEHNEKEIIKLQNEKLEADVTFKNKELASTTMHLVHRGKLLAKIKEELLPIIKSDTDKAGAEEYRRILRLINEAEKSDADWEQFSVHFDQVHSNFLTKLKEKFPNLSANDLKLCAYLKMNLSSKEIAQLMSITIRAVEVSRYRLRKKLQLPTDTSLFDYLISVTH